MAARWDLLNALARHLKARRYLEIGVQTGDCFRRVEVPEKVGVDPARNSAATVYLSSDEWFAGLGKDQVFDLIFVDGLHLREQVHRDLLNAWDHLTPGGAVLVHDCDPPSERAGRRDLCPGIWCGDVWRGWMDTRHDLCQAAMGAVETDLGCGLLLSGDAPRPPLFAPVKPPWTRTETDRATWAFFVEHRREWLNALSVDDFFELMARLPELP